MTTCTKNWHRRELCERRSTLIIPLLAKRDAQSGELRGLAVDMSAEIARRIGLPMRLVAFPAASQITETAKDNVWDVGYLAIDPRRANDIDFTAPYLELEGTFAVSVDSSFSTAADIDRQGVNIAVTKGSAYDLFLSRTISCARLVRVHDTPTSIEMLLSRRVDAAAAVRTALAAAVLERAEYRVLKRPFMTIPQAVGVPCGRIAAARYLREVIEDLKSSGFIAKTLRKFGLSDDDAVVAPAAPQND